MKKALTLLFTLLCLTIQPCMGAGREFQKFPGSMEVHTVYISPTAVKLGMLMGGGKLGELQKIVKKTESIEIMSTDRYDSHSALNQECKSVVQKKNMELILNCADGLTKTNIYIGELLNDKEIRDVIIESQEGSSYNVVYIKGIIDAEKLTESYNEESSREIESVHVSTDGKVRVFRN